MLLSCCFAAMLVGITLFAGGCAGNVDDSSAEGNGGASTMSIEGVIVDRSGNPLPGVVVTLVGGVPQTATSAHDGGFVFGGLAAGSYTLRLGKIGCIFSPSAVGFAPKSAGVVTLYRNAIRNFVHIDCRGEKDGGDDGDDMAAPDASPDRRYGQVEKDAHVDARVKDAGHDTGADSVAVDTGVDAADAFPTDAAPDVCIPIDTCSPSQTCGTIVGNCGQTVDCGTCTAPESCGGGGIPNVCGVNVCDTNTQQCLTSRDITPGSCFACAAAVGCFDPTFGGHSCEDLTTSAPVSCQSVLASSAVATETQVCLATLKGFFSSHCAAGAQPNPCLCGTVAPDLCLGGIETPAGPLFPLYQCDLGPNIANINNDFLSPSKGAGVANAIIECAHSFSCACQF